ncbi:hypothetical protein B484DRAFT_429403 [Ochromonadaceae sp. CCMP2298]|nr:hypothetical protein B484DRAFT_429403 [Ochromonadaceae sp. CCMP2298]
MNPRQLSQGLVPAPEYERYHTYHSLRQFPELRRSVQDMQFINLRSKEGTNPQSHSQGLSRSITTRSTHMLSELTQSSVGDVSAMDDYRKILLENRKKMKNSASTLKPKAVKLAPIASTASEDDDSSLGFTTFLEKADKKLTKISISYDAQSYNSHLQGFSGALLAKEEFGTQLRRCLNINLKKKELSALFDKMDDDSSGLIDGVEFVRYFFALGTQARWSMQMQTVAMRSRKQSEKVQKKVDDIQRIKDWEASQISTFTPEDLATATRKLEEAAFKWDPSNHIEALSPPPSSAPSSTSSLPSPGITASTGTCF